MAHCPDPAARRDTPVLRVFRRAFRVPRRVHGRGGPAGAVSRDGEDAGGDDLARLGELGRAAILCNDSSVRERNGTWSVEGDPMEGALLALAGRIGLDASGEAATWPRTGTVPFDSRHRFMATLNHGPGNRAAVYVKGAPETVLAMCAEQRDATGGNAPLEDAYWRDAAEDIASRGQRVLALAALEAPGDWNAVEVDDIRGRLTLLGLAGLIDPPRSEAIEAVEECRQGGDPRENDHR